MAVIEIAKIQVRRGQENQTGIPQLAGGEFAWAEDTENLYIGLKREDGGARDANIRILTENDVRLFNNFVSTAALNAYYTWEIDNSPFITSSTNINTVAVVRSAQNKLDDFVSVADFGVVASTATYVVDCTDSLQRAIDHLFLNHEVTGSYLPYPNDYDTQGSLRYNKKLFFPAGVYRLGGTVFIPKNTVIVGEGMDKTVIENITTGSSIFQTVDYNERRTNPTLGKFNPTSLAITGGGQPTNIHIEGMTLRYSTSTGVIPHLSLLSLDCVDNAVVRNVKFEGYHSYSLGALSNPDYTGIDIRGNSTLLGGGAVTSENILIDNCEFTGLYYDIKSNYDTNHVVIQNSSFKYSSYGIGLSTVTNLLESSTGPQYFRIINNKFQSIEHEGIYVGANSTGVATNHVSENNSFINVGNEGGGTDLNGRTPVITFATPGNASVNDYFDRQRYHNANFGSPVAYLPLIDGRATIDLNSVSTATLVANTSTTIMRLPITGNAQYLSLKYNCTSYDGTINKLGTLQVYIRPGSTPSDVQLYDEYNVAETDGGLYWGITVEPAYKYYELIGVNPTLTSAVQVELQTKLML
jgi:hypothetical protein